MEGQVTRAAGPAFEQMLVGAGASIASMPSSEIYTAMRTGVLDAANTSSGSFVSYRIYEQVKCLTEPGSSEEHTSELQSLMRISYAVFCLQKQQIINRQH